MLKKIKVFGDFVYPRCIRKGSKLVCKPLGKRYKFLSYKYVIIDDETPDQTLA